MTDTSPAALKAWALKEAMRCDALLPGARRKELSDMLTEDAALFRALKEPTT